MSVPTISRITVAPPLCPLYEYLEQKGLDVVSTQRKTYFSRSPYNIWSAINGGTTYPPCAISADSTNLDIPVGFHLNPQQALESGKLWALEVRLQPFPGSSGASSTPFISFSGTWDDSTREVTANLVTPKYNDGSTRPLPWAFRGQLIWTVAKETGEVVDKGTLSLELYVLSSYIPKYMKTGGIPLDLLRLPTLIPTWMMSEKDPNLVLGWSSFVTQALFNDNRLWYDIWNGQSAYCGVNWEGTSSSSMIVLWMDLWLSDMNGITKRGSVREKYAVNCHDTANLTAAIASLGLPDKDTLLYSCLVEEFGFIKETFLIGRHSKPEALEYTGADKCNNPFYGKAKFNKKMKCQPKESNRSAFAEHKFVMQAAGLVAEEPSPGDPVVGLLTNPRVLDSCTGPHLGAEEPAEYIKNTVDTVLPPNSSSKLVTVENINRDPDIYALAPRPAMVRAVKSQALPESIYKSMIDLFGEVPYQVMEPCEGFTDPYSESMIVTWTVIKNDAVDIDGNRGELHINISRFYTQEDVQVAYDRRRGMFKNGTYKEDSTNPKNGLNFTQKPGPGFFMFWAPAGIASGESKAVPHFLVTIDSTLSSDLLVLGDQSPVSVLKERFKSLGATEKHGKEALAISIIECPESVHLGQEFTAILKVPNQQSAQWWRGAMGQPLNGHATLLDVAYGDQNMDGSIALRFLATMVGVEKIRFTLYGLNLDGVYGTRNIHIIA